MTFILTLLVAIPLGLLRGVVIVDLWEWFITPTFGLEPISLVAAVGINLLVHFLAFQNAKSAIDDNMKGAERLGVACGISVMLSLTTWGYGLIFSYFM